MGLRRCMFKELRDKGVEKIRVQKVEGLRALLKC